MLTWLLIVLQQSFFSLFSVSLNLLLCVQPDQYWICQADTDINILEFIKSNDILTDSNNSNKHSWYRFLRVV